MSCFNCGTPCKRIIKCICRELKFADQKKFCTYKCLRGFLRKRKNRNDNYFAITFKY